MWAENQFQVFQPWTPAGQHAYSHGNESAEHLGRVSKAHIPGIQKLADDLCFDVGISLARVSASRTVLTHLLSSQTRMLTLELLLLLYNHAPLSRTPLFSSLSPCTLFLCQVWLNHMFSAAAQDDALKPEAQVCPQARGGIGTRSMDGGKQRWTCKLLRCAGWQEHQQLLAWGCCWCPALGYSFDGLHATSNGCVGVWISDPQRVLILSLACLLHKSGFVSKSPWCAPDAF